MTPRLDDSGIISVLYYIYLFSSSKLNFICLCRFRKCNAIPPRPAEEDKVLIRQRGEW